MAERHLNVNVRKVGTLIGQNAVVRFQFKGRGVVRYKSAGGCLGETKVCSDAPAIAVCSYGKHPFACPREIFPVELYFLQVGKEVSDE